MPVKSMPAIRPTKGQEEDRKMLVMKMVSPTISGRQKTAPPQNRPDIRARVVASEKHYMLALLKLVS